MPSNLTVLFIASRKLIHCRYDVFDANACSRAFGGVCVCVCVLNVIYILNIFLLLVFIFKLLIWAFCRDVVDVMCAFECVVVECECGEESEMLRDNNRNENLIFSCVRASGFNCLCFCWRVFYCGDKMTKRTNAENHWRAQSDNFHYLFLARQPISESSAFFSLVFRFQCSKC